MTASETRSEIAAPAPPLPGGDAALPMALLELELSLDRFSGSKDDFSSFVRTVADDVGGELLFVLPASGLVDNCLTIAVLRHSQTDGQTPAILFVCLDEDASSIRVEQPSERTAGLTSFADAFVDVLERI
ncbi:hypothetical protein ABIE78_004978 [Sinorhizobium fredii]|uniref:Uncharacterized protein n=1 Tax=Sinorhizobium fredii (strain USDA 257) TaxID=1185652 RepID=I3X049_SINF2|nr:MULTISPECIES: hypothetical protein [Sinorhizobium]AFL49255.1 hypothetical protein USDA257_c06600 [Sinorhizobium fredii USDA 257]PDT85457.1 hypothetical protein CO676_05125 [Sinorhizobium sp. BJ1]